MNYLRTIDFSFASKLNNPITEGGDESLVKEKMHVAVGDDVEEGKSILMWALQYRNGRKICVIHVHVPAQMIPLPGGKYPASTLKPTELQAYRDTEKKNMDKLLNDYVVSCKKLGVNVEVVSIERDNIEKGILDMISEHGIKKLVVGAAARIHYSKKMVDLKSKKAIYINQEAPLTCHLLFVCNGYLIRQRYYISRNVTSSSSETESIFK